MTPHFIAELNERANNPNTRIEMIDVAEGPLTAPLTDRQQADSEERLGFAPPGVLTVIYRAIANGGFGPGYGLLGLSGGFTDEGMGAIEYYQQFRQPDPEDSEWMWPEYLVPICHWGCCIYSCIDVRTQQGRIVTFDSGAREREQGMSAAIADTHDSLESWLNDWVRGVKIWSLMFELDQARAREITNPFTGERTVYVPNKLRHRDIT